MSLLIKAYYIIKSCDLVYPASQKIVLILRSVKDEDKL